MSRVAPSICKDCENFVVGGIVISNEGIPVWVCPECGCAHEDHSWYYQIGVKTMKNMIERKSQIVAKGLFVCSTGIEYIGIDTTGEELLYEEFPDLTECLRWLLESK